MARLWGATMRDLELLHGSQDARTSGEARDRLAIVLAETHERRAKLERQLVMANEFVDQLSGRLA